MGEKKDTPENGGNDTSGPREKIAGLVQKTIGGLEEIGGILTGDPITAAEGEYNVDAGSIREEIGEDLEKSDKKDVEGE
jgi:uncharacterized protein YjbJ (UPF0337 family)